MTFRWGIMGTGYAARKFVLGLRQSSTSKAVLVASRSYANAQKFAQTLSIPTVAESYEAGAEVAEVDAFYIATPPALHREHALLCISAGKPVLIEKPLAHTVQDARAIISAARDAQVFCMEGIWTRFLPLISRIKVLVADEEIGELRSFSGSFGKSNIPDKALNVFNGDLGGGATLHRGVYPLSIACHFMGAVKDVVSAARFGQTDVDEDSVIVLRHTLGGLSTITASLRANLANEFKIVGTHGTIHVLAPIYRPYRLKLTKTAPISKQATGSHRFESLKESTLLQSTYQRLDVLARLMRQGRSQTIWQPYKGNGYHYEANEVMRCIQAGEVESSIMPSSGSHWKSAWQTLRP